MYEIPSLSGDTLDFESGSEHSASDVIAEAIEELENKIKTSHDKEDAQELAVLRLAESALNANGGDRSGAIAWLKEKSETDVNMEPASAEAAAKWLEHLQG
jgi:hypothetical protein